MIAKIEFGKHKGEHFCDIPGSYLQWFVGLSTDHQMKRQYPQSLSAAVYELGLRKNNRQSFTQKEVEAMKQKPKNYQQIVTMLCRENYTYYMAMYPDETTRRDETIMVRSAQELTVGRDVLLTDQTRVQITEVVDILDVPLDRYNAVRVLATLNTETYDRQTLKEERLCEQLEAADARKAIADKIEAAREAALEAVDYIEPSSELDDLTRLLQVSSETDV